MIPGAIRSNIAPPESITLPALIFGRAAPMGRMAGKVRTPILGIGEMRRESYKLQVAGCKGLRLKLPVTDVLNKKSGRGLPHSKTWRIQYALPSTSAFTLMELLVVCLLIAVMAAIIVPEMRSSFEDALLRSSGRK